MTESNFEKFERPIGSKSEDLLDRGNFVKKLADSIVNKKTRRASGVTVGITGPWGTGKSSILNLLEEEIRCNYPNAVVVRFDPWLISNRDSLIEQFLLELKSALDRANNEDDQWRKLSQLVEEYAHAVAPNIKFSSNLSGLAWNGFWWALKKLSRKPEGASYIKRQILEQTNEISQPIIVLIDELDRIENDEVRSLAQLVRAIMDFDHMSFVLAYDHDRVCRALGAFHFGKIEDQINFGRDYLEKIVHLSVPIPLCSNVDIKLYLEFMLDEISCRCIPYENFKENNRYMKLCDILCQDLLGNFRSVKKVVRAYEVMWPMVNGEVDWVDVFGYSCIISLYPEIDYAIKTIGFNLIQRNYSSRMMPDKNRDKVEHFRAKWKAFIGRDEPPEKLKNLLSFLFPAFQEGWTDWGIDDQNISDPIRRARSFSVMAKLGLPKSELPSEFVRKIYTSGASKVLSHLENLYKDEGILAFALRVDDIYNSLIDNFGVRLEFWSAVSEFVLNYNDRSPSSVVFMREISNAFSGIVEKSFRNDPKKYNEHRQVLDYWMETNIHFASKIVRQICFDYGIWGSIHSSSNKQLLNIEEARNYSQTIVEAGIKMHLGGDLFSKAPDFDLVFHIYNAGNWNNNCFASARDQIADNNVLDLVVLKIFGSGWGCGSDTLEALFEYNYFKAHVSSRIEGVRRAIDPERTNEGSFLLDQLQRALESYGN